MSVKKLNYAMMIFSYKNGLSYDKVLEFTPLHIAIDLVNLYTYQNLMRK